MCILNPKVDFVFKKLFGSEENKDILLSFINAVLEYSNKKQHKKYVPIKKITLKNPYNLSSYVKGKMSILDIKAEDEQGTFYDIEIQNDEDKYFVKRAMYYLAKVYSDQMVEGMPYENLKKTIGINLLNYNFLKETDFHNVYLLYNAESKEELPDDIIEMHFIEMNKFKKSLSQIKMTIDRWIMFLNKAYEYEKDRIPKELSKDRNVKKAIEHLDIMYLNKEEREIYEGMLKWQRDYVSKLLSAESKGVEKGKEKGREEGRKEGLQEGIEKGREEAQKELVKNMQNNGLSLEQISEITKLSLEEVKKILD